MGALKCVYTIFVLDSDGMPWCAIQVHPTTGSMQAWALCPDERKLIYDGGAQSQYCQVPFLMNGTLVTFQLFS